MYCLWLLSHWWSRVVVTETLRPIKPQIFTIEPFIGKVSWPPGLKDKVEEIFQKVKQKGNDTYLFGSSNKQMVSWVSSVRSPGGLMLVKNKGGGIRIGQEESLDRDVDLTPVKWRRKGNKSGKREPDFGVDQSLDQPSGGCRAKTVHWRSPTLGRKGQVLVSPLCSVIGWAAQEDLGLESKAVVGLKVTVVGGCQPTALFTAE